MSDGTQALRIVLLAAFSGIGLLLLSFAAWMAANNIEVLLTHEHARAEVVRSERLGMGSSRRITYSAVRVRYDGPQGRRTAQISRTTGQYEPGEIISVYYKPETPGTAVAGSFMAMWFFPMVLGIPGLVSLFFGLRPKDLRRSPTTT